MQINIFQILFCGICVSSAFFYNIRPRLSPRILRMSDTPVKTDDQLKDQVSYHWYVIGRVNQFTANRPYKKTIWDKNYVVWKNKQNEFYAIENECSHRGAELSGGRIMANNTVMCPYHGYEYNTEGVLSVVPGLNFTNTPCQNIPAFKVVVQDEWVYLNTVPDIFKYSNEEFPVKIYREPEATDPKQSRIFIEANFENYGRLVSENSLDVMHIGYVHTFGNKERPSPINEIPPHRINETLMHYRTQYDYLSGKQSAVKRVFSIDKLTIENEFILPHTTVARVIFGKFTSTVITAALPINMTHTKLYVKTYRNYWNNADMFLIGRIYNTIGDWITENLMMSTVNQDKSVVNGILFKDMDGRFNMKFDKLQNTYRSLYKKFIHPGKN
jgi:phenylpropionate dioxygenase-like ring-hydroxylating dioxygenase large terminal subunit